MSLESIFSPRSIAVIGASNQENSVGRAVLENLNLFTGPVFPVNPKYGEIAGRKAWAGIGKISQPVDLAIVITPAPTVPGVVAECAAAGVKGVVVISAGFREVGPAGAALEARVLAAVRAHGMRLIGPNCLGVMVPSRRLNATFARNLGRPGRVAFLSQSGALATAILDLSLRENVGFSAFVSVGSMGDVGWGDLIRHFGNDPDTQSIVIYMESVGDASSFMDAARAVAAAKPIVVMKVGRTSAAARAAASHTGAMTGSDAVLDAALRQCGVLRVDTIEELFDLAEIMAKNPLPRGPRLGIVTNAGGPGALAVDALVGQGGELATLSSSCLESLDRLLPAHWSHGNPVDVLGDAGPERFASAVRLVAADEQVDGLLAIVTPQAMTQPTDLADAVVAATQGLDKPVLCSWMGGASVFEAQAKLNGAGLPTHEYPDAAARAFVLMRERSLRLEWLSETLRARAHPASVERPPAVVAVIESAQAAGRRLLTEVEAKSLLREFGLSVVATHPARTEEEAVRWAEAIGFPVVLKLQSDTVTHKSDVGGVKLNLASASEVRSAWHQIKVAVKADDFQGVSVQPMVAGEGWELILGASHDAQFGRVLLIGAGGVLAEILQDRALVLPPLTPEIARRWISRTRIFRILKGVRGKPPADLDALVAFLVRFDHCLNSCPEILEIDVNPLVVSDRGSLALDARIVLRA